MTTRNEDGRVWDGRLMCCPVRLAYDFSKLTGELYLVDGDCCDMAGCVRLFRAIDPLVSRIITYSGAAADTIYEELEGRWHARL